jgi:hypothetical protein
MKTLKEFYYIHVIANRPELSMWERVDAIRDFASWIEADNVVKLGANRYKEHTTQWRKTFTAKELIEFYEKEYVFV